MMPYWYTNETFEINGVNMLCPAWIVMDLANLWVPVHTFENRIASGEPGSTALDGAEEELRTGLPFKLTGLCDPDGVAYDDTQVGFRRNWLALCGSVFLTTIGEAVYWSGDPDEDPIEFAIQIPTPSISERYPTDWAGTLQVILPDGALTGSGS